MCQVTFGGKTCEFPQVGDIAPQIVKSLRRRGQCPQFLTGKDFADKVFGCVTSKVVPMSVAIAQKIEGESFKHDALHARLLDTAFSLSLGELRCPSGTFTTGTQQDSLVGDLVTMYEQGVPTEAFLKLVEKHYQRLTAGKC